MHNKKILILGGGCLLMLCALVAYFIPEKLHAQRKPPANEAYVPLSIPAEVQNAFFAQFNAVKETTEVKFMPDGAFVNGKEKLVRFADFKGKPTLVNFWATWCMPCVVELPYLQKLKNYYESRMNVIAISIDQNADLVRISDFLEKREIGDFAAYMDRDGEITQNLAMRGIPTSFLIGSDGRILYIFEGDADWTHETAKNFFDTFLLQNN